MNSKQLNFFIVPEDLQSIYLFFLKRKVKYVVNNVEDSDNIILNDFPFRHGKIFERIHLTCEEFKPYLSFKYDESRKTFYVDSDRSYILDFNPGGFYPASSKVLHRGRLYCATSYFVSNRESVAKSDLFRTWVDDLFKLFKKDFLMQYTPNKSILFSKSAIKWIEENNGNVDTAFLTVII